MKIQALNSINFDNQFSTKNAQKPAKFEPSATAEIKDSVSFGNNNAEKNNRKYAYIGAGIIATIGVAVGIKKMLSRPTKADKQLAALLDGRLEKAEECIKKFQNDCENLYNDSIEKLHMFPGGRRIYAPDLAKSKDQLANARSNEEILNAEDALFSDIDNWFKKDIMNSTKNSIDPTKLAMDLTEEVHNKHLKILGNSVINTDIRNIPDKLLGARHSEEIIKNFYNNFENKANILSESSDYVNKLFTQDIKAYMGDIYSARGDILATKFKEQGNILNKIKDRIPGDKLSERIEIKDSKLPKTKPSNMPKSLSENYIIRFIMQDNKTDKDYSDYLKLMGLHLNLKDFKVLEERLKIRSILSDSDYDKKWYQIAEKNVSTLGEKIEKELNKIYLTPVKNSDKLDSDKAEELLKDLANKYGYSSIGDMNFQMIKKYGINSEYNKCDMAKLYQKYKDDFLESYSTLILIIEREGKPLFNWDEIN